MKKLYTALFVLLLANATRAQVTLQTDTSFCSGPSSEFVITCNNHVLNGSSNAYALKWSRTVMGETPSAWEVQICDNQNCWGPAYSTRNFNLSPNENADLKVNFVLNGTPGTGAVKVNVTDTDGSGINLESVFVAQTDATGTSATVQQVKDIMLYPTPVRERVYVMFNPSLKPERVDVHNVLGQKVKSFPIQLERNNYRTELALSDLDKGLYFVRVYQNGGQQVITKQFTKE